METETDSYAKLLQVFPPRPIRSEEEKLATQSMIDSIIDSDEELTPEQKDYIGVLGTLVWVYEQAERQFPDIHGTALLQALIDEHALRHKDLAHIFKTESIVSEILSGRRNLTSRHIYELAKFFQISPAAFFPE